MNKENRRLYRAIQDRQWQSGRAMRVAFPETLTALPDATTRANKALAFGADGQPALIDPPSGLPTSAENVSYLAPGDDAAALSVAEKLADFRTLHDYDVTAGSGDDDTAAFDAAIDYWVTNGGVLIIPAGQYIITSTIKKTVPTDDKPRCLLAYGARITWNGSSGYAIHLRRAGTNTFVGTVAFRGWNAVLPNTYTGSAANYGFIRCDDATNFEWHHCQFSCRRGNAINIRNTFAWSENVMVISCRFDAAYGLVRFDRPTGTDPDTGNAFTGTNSLARFVMRDCYIGPVYGPYALFPAAADLSLYDACVENIKGNVGNLAIAFVAKPQYGGRWVHHPVESYLSDSATLTGSFDSATDTITVSAAAFVAGRDDPESTANVDGVTFDKGTSTLKIGRRVRFTDSGGTVRIGRVKQVTSTTVAVLHTGSGAANGAITGFTRYGYRGVERRDEVNPPTIMNFLGAEDGDATAYSLGAQSYPVDSPTGFQTDGGGFRVRPPTFKSFGTAIDARLGDSVYGLLVSNLGKSANPFRADAYFGKGVANDSTESRVNFLSGTGSALWQFHASGGFGQNSSSCGTFAIGFASSSGPSIADMMEFSGSKIRVKAMECYANNTYDFGTGSIGIKQIYSNNSLSVISDGTLKSPLVDFSDALLDAVDACRLGLYQWLDRIAAKAGTDEDARWHAGLIAQEFEAAMLAHGVDPATIAAWMATPLVETVTEEQEVTIEVHIYAEDEQGMLLVGEDGGFVVAGTRQEKRIIPVQVERPVLDGNGVQIIRYHLRPEQVLIMLAACERRARAKLTADLAALSADHLALAVRVAALEGSPS